MGSVDFDTDRGQLFGVNVPGCMHASCAFSQQQANSAMQKTKWLPSRVCDGHAQGQPLFVHRYDLNSQRLQRRVWNKPLKVSQRFQNSTLQSLVDEKGFEAVKLSLRHRMLIDPSKRVSCAFIRREDWIKNVSNYPIINDQC
jgi:hypothetical protein